MSQQKTFQTTGSFESPTTTFLISFASPTDFRLLKVLPSSVKADSKLDTKLETSQDPKNFLIASCFYIGETQTHPNFSKLEDQLAFLSESGTRNLTPRGMTFGELLSGLESLNSGSGLAKRNEDSEIENHETQPTETLISKWKKQRLTLDELTNPVVQTQSKTSVNSVPTNVGQPNIAQSAQNFSITKSTFLSVMAKILGWKTPPPNIPGNELVLTQYFNEMSSATINYFSQLCGPLSSVCYASIALKVYSLTPATGGLNDVQLSGLQAQIKLTLQKISQSNIYDYSAWKEPLKQLASTIKLDNSRVACPTPKSLVEFWKTAKGSKILADTKDLATLVNDANDQKESNQ